MSSCHTKRPRGKVGGAGMTKVLSKGCLNLSPGRGDRALLEHASQNLARRRLGNRVDELDGADLFVGRDPLRHVSHEVGGRRSEEHTSELQSRLHLVCRLLLEKKNVR